MRRLAPTLCIAILAVAGCGGDDGLVDDGPSPLDTPAKPRADAELPAVEGDGLLHPEGERPKRARRKQRAKERRESRADGGRGRSKRTRGARQQVAGRRDSNGPGYGTLESGRGPETGAPSEPRRAPELSAAQRAELGSVEAALREMFDRMNARDASVCGDLMTLRHMEQATGLRGDAAVGKCRADIRSSGASYRLNKVSGIRIEGDTAWIRFASSIGDYARWQILRAVRSPGGSGWKFDGDGSQDV